ncbi:MFS transporter [Myxococcota bacterium]|nr:MFS transporter [Myxococcota bacterium]
MNQPQPTPPLALLGAAAALAPFTGSMPIPTLTSVGEELSARPEEATRVISVFFLAFATSMVPAGALSDRVGRRPVAIAGLTLLAVSSVAAALAPTLETLLVARFFQGLGAAAPMNLTRAVIRDGASGDEATRAMSVVSVFQSAGPAIAPIAGALLGWRVGFGALSVAALLLVGLSTWRWNETLPPGPKTSPFSQLHHLGGGPFIPFGVALTALSSIWFSFVAIAPAAFVGSGWLTQQGLGLMLTGVAFSLVGGATAAQVSLKRGLSSDGVLRVGAAIVLLSGVGLAGMSLAAPGLLPPWIALFFAYAFGNGMMTPPAVMRALTVPSSAAGVASALIGAVQLLGGALAAELVPRLTDSLLTSFAWVTLVCLGVMVGALSWGSARLKTAAA